jgi:S-adenosylmethionine:tRNA ribosyltransferase-isomerase
MKVSDFDFDLPAELVAQEPAARGESRMLVLDRASGTRTHASIADLPELLRSGDALVVNDTRVFPARLLGRRVPSGGAVECLLMGPLENDRWDALMHPGQKLREGARITFGTAPRELHAEVLERRFHGRRTIRLWTDDRAGIDERVDELGHVPLPPYIKRADRPEDRERYQTVYARTRGSVAAPTAGLHFTADLLDRLAARGVERIAITLHVGYGTFKPVRTDEVEEHHVDPETYEISAVAAEALNRALDDGRRVVAVGTTTTRALESAARLSDFRSVRLPASAEGSGEASRSALRARRLQAERGTADLFIYPGYAFKVVGGLLTNFHLPRSSLLMLVSAFAGRELILDTYREAIERRYRFYSYGDAMLIL